VFAEAIAEDSVPRTMISTFRATRSPQSAARTVLARTAGALAPLLALACGEAGAHSFGTVYNLPVPFWMYAYGATAALVVSFAIVAYFAGVPAAISAARTTRTAGRRYIGTLPRALVLALRIVAVFLLGLCIVAGFVGSRNTLSNINMTLFWIVFALGLYYLTALIGDVYAIVNPWRTLCDAVERLFPRAFRARARYPAWLGYYPALALYGAYIWFELFGRSQPRSLAYVLVAYTAVNFVAAAIVGKEAWFRYGEFFAVLFRLAGLLAPVEYVDLPDARSAYRISVRMPFVALLEEPATHFSMLLFVLFTLSSTAFDGIHETLPWVGLFWKGVYPSLAAVTGLPYLKLVNFYYYWQWVALIVSPFIYLAIYLVFIRLSRDVAGSKVSVRELALRFALTLVPIAFVYNVTHYYTLIASQGISMVRLISDPFGFGWDLFGTLRSGVDTLVLDAGGVWHTQVGLILVGHIVAVYLAHIEALRVFPSTRRAVISQLPMLILMVLFTAAGLWILSLPIASGQVVQPTPGGG